MRPNKVVFLGLLASMMVLGLYFVLDGVPADHDGQSEAQTIPQEVSVETCGKCHSAEFKYWQYGAHRSIPCQECHGPGAKHASSSESTRPKMTLADHHLCLSCHQSGQASHAKSQPLIDSFEAHLEDLETKHNIRLDRGKSGKSCVFCHDPHLLE